RPVHRAETVGVDAVGVDGVRETGGTLGPAMKTAQCFAAVSWTVAASVPPNSAIGSGNADDSDLNPWTASTSRATPARTPTSAITPATAYQARRGRNSRGSTRGGPECVMPAMVTAARQCRIGASARVDRRRPPADPSN